MIITIYIHVVHNNMSIVADTESVECNNGLVASAGVSLDPLTSARPDVLARLCAEYTTAATAASDITGRKTNGDHTAAGSASSACRAVRHVDGTLIPSSLLTPLREALERTVFPERRQRAGLQAAGYFVLAPPGTAHHQEQQQQQQPATAAAAAGGGGEEEGGSGVDARKHHQHDDGRKTTRRNASKAAAHKWRQLTTAQKKIARQQAAHGPLWRAAAALLEAADPVFASHPFHVAVTKDFTGADTHTPFLLFFLGGGAISEIKTINLPRQAWDKHRKS
jgi:hypothetical protein